MEAKVLAVCTCDKGNEREFFSRNNSRSYQQILFRVIISRSGIAALSRIGLTVRVISVLING